jgi:hypothetical protein
VPDPLPAELCLEPSAADFLEANRSGIYQEQDPTPLQRFASELRLEKFLWSWYPSYRGSCFLILAGRTGRSGQFYSLTAPDLDHFAMFGGHTAALLNNALILHDLEDEREELASANKQLDSNVKKLERTQRRLIESTTMMVRASRKAGMAEVATGVLHNVGNVLNSVNVCAEVAQVRAQDLQLDKLVRIAELVANQENLQEFFRSEVKSSLRICGR